MCSLKVRTCCIWCSSPGAGRCEQMGAELKRSSAVRSALKEAGKQHHWLFSERCGDISAQNTPGCESKGCHFMSIHSLFEGEKRNTGKYWELFARIFYWRWKDFSWMLLWGLNLPFLLWTSDRAVFKEIGTEFCPVSWAAELSPIYYSCKLGTLQSSRPANIGLWSRWGLPFYKGKGWSSNEVTMVVVLYSCSIRMRKAPLCTFSRETFLILMLSQKAETLTHTTRACSGYSCKEEGHTEQVSWLQCECTSKVQMWPDLVTCHQTVLGPLQLSL